MAMAEYKRITKIMLGFAFLVWNNNGWRFMYNMAVAVKMTC